MTTSGSPCEKPHSTELYFCLPKDYLGLVYITTFFVPVDVDGVRIGAPDSEALLDDLLDLREVRLQGLVTEHFGKNLQRQNKRHTTII